MIHRTQSHRPQLWGREARLAYFAEEKCDTGPVEPSTPDEEKDDKKKKDIKGSIHIDVTPNEPYRHYNRKGEVQDNPSKQVRTRTQDELKADLDAMFKKHLRSNLKSEIYRPQNLAARAEYAKQKRAGKEVKQPDYKEMMKKAEAEAAGVRLPLEKEQWESMLDEATDIIFTDEAFQRGTVNYLHAYEKAWNVYFDAVENNRLILEEGGTSDHPVLHTGAFKTRRAPGLYQNGALIEIPSTFLNKRPRSEYADAKIRERAGESQDPDRDIVREKARQLRRDYGEAWANNFKEKYPLAKSKDIEAHVNGLIENRLKEQGASPDLIANRDQPARGVPVLPPDAWQQPHGDESLPRRVDLRDRGMVATALSDTLHLETESVDAVDKKVKVSEVNWGDREAGFPQILAFRTTPALTRGVYKEPIRSGLLFIDQQKKGEKISRNDVHVLEYKKVEEMVNTLSKNRLYTPLLESGKFFSPTQEKVLKELRLASSADEASTYLDLNATLRGTSPYPVDELLKIYEDFFPLAKKTIDQLVKLKFGRGNFQETIEDWGRLRKMEKDEFLETIVKEISYPPAAVVERVLRCYFEKSEHRENFIKLFREAVAKSKK